VTTQASRLQTSIALSTPPGILGGALALYGVNGLSSKYENFLLLISYWIGPWLAIVCVDFFLHPGQPSRPGRGLQTMQSVIEWPGLIAFLVGLAVSIPFMNSSLYTGPIAVLLHGADIAYYVGIIVAGVLYYVLRLATTRSTASRAGTLDNV
jgi:nucleobase:cation symporter-1, NCS1 family